jgi:hypothetical protein
VRAQVHTSVKPAEGADASLLETPSSRRHGNSFDTADATRRGTLAPAAVATSPRKSIGGVEHLTAAETETDAKTRAVDALTSGPLVTGMVVSVDSLPPLLIKTVINCARNLAAVQRKQALPARGACAIANTCALCGMRMRASDGRRWRRASRASAALPGG